MILSIVVPCYNESEVINETSRRLISVLEGLIKKEMISPDSFILFVNDGSRIIHGNLSVNYIRRVSMYMALIWPVMSDTRMR